MKKKTLFMFVLLVFLVSLYPTQSASPAGDIGRSETSIDDTDVSRKNYTELILDWKTKKVCIKKKKKEKVIEKKSDEKDVIPRISSNTKVAIRVKNFNFFHYSLQYAIDETVIEPYRAVKKLWAEIFGLAQFVSTIEKREDHQKRLSEDLAKLNKELKGLEKDIDELEKESIESKEKKSEEKSELLEKKIEIAKEKIKLIKLKIKEVLKSQCELIIVDWAKEIIRTETKITTILSQIDTKLEKDKTSIDVEQNRNFLEGKKVELNDKKKEIQEKRIEAFETGVISKKLLDFYEQVEARHFKIVEKIDIFMNAANLTLNGRVENIGKKKSGTFVTVNITPTHLDKSQQPVKKGKVISYFVHSPFPVLFHVGYAFKTMKDVEFEKVRSLESTDLYAKVKDGKTDGFVGFLSWEIPFKKFLGFDISKFGMALSLGTDFSSPGKKLYAGVSLKLFTRLFITGGIASAVVAEADEDNKIVEEIIGTAKVRELYTTITKRREWQGFIGISFSFL